jgi:hypothetical protein
MGSLFPKYSIPMLSVAIGNEAWREVGGLEPQQVRNSLK